ncbi:hypothetical protein HPP05_14820 [Corallococcus exiguus]|nr:hypothetical protein [Corallococcus exiguus]
MFAGNDSVSDLFGGKSISLRDLSRDATKSVSVAFSGKPKPLFASPARTGIATDQRPRMAIPESIGISYSEKVLGAVCSPSKAGDASQCKVFFKGCEASTKSGICSREVGAITLTGAHRFYAQILSDDGFDDRFEVDFSESSLQIAKPSIPLQSNFCLPTRHFAKSRGVCLVGMDEPLPKGFSLRLELGTSVANKRALLPSEVGYIPSGSNLRIFGRQIVHRVEFPGGLQDLIPIDEPDVDPFQLEVCAESDPSVPLACATSQQACATALLAEHRDYKGKGLIQRCSLEEPLQLCVHSSVYFESEKALAVEWGRLTHHGAIGFLFHGKSGTFLQYCDRGTTKCRLHKVGSGTVDVMPSGVEPVNDLFEFTGHHPSVLDEVLQNLKFTAVYVDKDCGSQHPTEERK